MEFRYLIINMAVVWLAGFIYSCTASNICKKSDVRIIDPKVTVKSFTSSLGLTKDDISTSKMVVGCPKGYQMRVDYLWAYETYEQPNGNTLIEVNCSQLYALDKTQICYKGCAIPKLDDVVITPLPSPDKQGSYYNEGETVAIHCGEYTVESMCKDGAWSNLSDYKCPFGNDSSKSLALVLDTTTNMGEEISQVYEIVKGIVDRLRKAKPKYLINYVLVPFNDPDFYPMLVTINGTVLLGHLNMINQHGASGGKDCPELTLAAIHKSVKESFPGSDVFVFTDASSKEPERKISIIREATRKRIKVNFILTGFCGDNQMSDQSVYEEIADSTGGFMVNVEKKQIRELFDVIDGSLRRNEKVAHELININNSNMPYYVQVPCNKKVHQLTLTASCPNVNIISLKDNKDSELRFRRVATLADMITIMVQPATADYINLTLSCGERGSALVSATSIGDISFDYLFYQREVGNTLALTDTVDMNKETVVFVKFHVSVYDVTLTIVELNHEHDPIEMKKYLGGYIATFKVPQLLFYLKFQANYAGQVVQRLSSPIIPRQGCSELVLGRGVEPSTLLSRDRTRVQFSCQSDCFVLSHASSIVCRAGSWSNKPPTCIEAGYVCKPMEGPGNGTLLTDGRIVYKLPNGTCGQRVEVRCNTYFEIDGESETLCTPNGWTASRPYCRAVERDDEKDSEKNVLSQWWIWVVICVTTVVTISIMFTVICILVIKKGKRKIRIEYGTNNNAVTIPPEDNGYNDEDIYEVVDCNGNYPPVCQPLCGTGSLHRATGRPPMPPPPPATNSYGNLPNSPNLPPNPLYAQTNCSGYMPVSQPVNGSGDVRSNSMIYEDMQPTGSSNEFKTYDYATPPSHV